MFKNMMASRNPDEFKTKAFNQGPHIREGYISKAPLESRFNSFLRFTIIAVDF